MRVCVFHASSLVFSRAPLQTQICALGLRKTSDSEVGASINGVIFPAKDMKSFDKRENGYRRVLVPIDEIEMLSWQTLPSDAIVYAYVPYAPSVVEKYGKDDDGYPLCSGPEPPQGHSPGGNPFRLLPEEEAGLGLKPPSIQYPILQSYVDVVLTGCLEYGEDFAKEFIQTTFKWSPYWLNERTLARRPWVHEPQYVKIDQILKDPTLRSSGFMTYRKLESEYATWF